MLGHCGFEVQYKYKLQTIKDNIALLTPDILDQINQHVVKAGHQLFELEEGSLAGRCDSFILETNVHFSDDINLLYDAVRCAIIDTAKCCQEVGFILNYQVMQKLNDVDVTVDIVMETEELYPNLTSCSFDKGYHSPGNQKQLAEALEHCVMPKKGKRNKVENIRESCAEFKTFKRAHSAVESVINAQEIHGLYRCSDKGLDGFEKYVSLAIVARSLQKIGAELQKKEHCRRTKAKSTATAASCLIK
jgi:hypothetical protein